MEFRAPDSQHKVEKGSAYKDTRRFTEYFRDEGPKWMTSILILITLFLAPFYSPALAWLTIPISIFVALWSGSSKFNRTLPMMLPAELSPQKDFNDPVPGVDNVFSKASGTILLGNIRRGKAELWMTGKTLLTHMLLIGTTGSGKTETLLSMSSSTAFCMGGGLLYIDAKAAIKLLFQFNTLSRIFGREDDLRVINYSTGSRVVHGRSWQRMSNTNNLFRRGTADTAVQILAGLLPVAGGDSQYFLDRAVAILRTLMPALVELRDMGVLNIYPSLIAEYISVKKFMDLSKNHIEVNGVHYEGIKLSEHTMKILNNFLKQLPNFDPKKTPEKQHEEVHRQFGFAEGYFAKPLASLAGTYGHIYEADLGEADFVDIVRNNRILVVLVPAMKLAPEERGTLGKIVLSSIRVAMGEGLGEHGEGSREVVLDSLPIDLRIPTVITVDEYPEVAVKGFAVTATQGRGLGMSVIFAGQDIAGFIRASKEETDMIFGNTRLKVLMALEDSDISWQKFKQLASTMKVSVGGGWEGNSNGFNTYKASFSSAINDADRINFLDLKEQREGQAHIFERANIHRAQLFHHGISDKYLVDNFRINRMLMINPPDPDTVKTLQNTVMRNIEIQHLVDGEEDISVQHLTTLERISGIHGFIHDDKWPWRFLSTLNGCGNPEISSLTEGIQNLESSLNKTAEEQDSGGNDVAVAGEEHESGGNDVAVAGEEHESGDEPATGMAEKLKSTLAKAENSWVFSSVSDESGISNTQRIFDDMVEINTLAGQPEDAAAVVAFDTIDGVMNATTYPSKDFVAKEEDVENLWDAINTLGD